MTKIVLLKKDELNFLKIANIIETKNQHAISCLAKKNNSVNYGNFKDNLPLINSKRKN